MSQPEPVNRYAASQVGDVGAGATAAAPEQSAPQRQYRLKLEWPDRRRFLRTVGPLRLYAMAGAVMGVWAFSGLLKVAFEWSRSATFSDSYDATYVLRMLCSVAQGAIALYMCWLHWNLADVIARTIGGADPRMSRWSRLQLRMAHVSVALIALGVVTMIVEWLLNRSTLATLDSAPP